MPLTSLILLALIQGITEFLPVSSSGHLILLPNLIGTADQGLALDVAVHVGSLGAVMLYYRHDVARAFYGTAKLARSKPLDADSHLALALMIATVPVVIAGAALKLSGLSDALRSVEVIGWTMLIFGAVLYWADRHGSETRIAKGWTLKHAIIMGLWQVLALIPGTSRAGITITGARFLGYGREDAARLAMLMSIPTIIASGALLSFDFVQDISGGLLRDAAIAAGFAFVAAYAALWAMIRFLARVNFTPYVIYRCVLGVVLLLVAYS